MMGNLIVTPENMLAFERSMELLDNSIRALRQVAYNLVPEALVASGLNTALKDFCLGMSQSGALQVNYQSVGMENVAIDQTAAIAAYRIVQELVNNTIKHAGAATAFVQVTKEKNQLSITVEDDGNGFDTRILQSPLGTGLHNIRHRVSFLKGRMVLQSDQMKGTSIYIELAL